MRNDGAERGQAYARVLASVFPEAGVRFGVALALLEEQRVTAEAAELDSHLGRTRRFVGAVDDALEGLGPRGFLALQAATERSPILLPEQLPADWLTDAVARRLLAVLRQWPTEAADLAVATGRLIEECAVLNPGSRRTTPLGAGFEQRRQDRLRRRFELLAKEPELLDSLEDHRERLLEAPDDGLRLIEATIGRRLSRRERQWLEAERFAAMLDIARSNVRKTEAGQIRYFLRNDPAHGPVLDRYGAHGHWLVVGDQEPGTLARAGVLAARATDERREAEPTSWRALVLDDHLASAAEDSARPGSVPVEEAHALPGAAGNPGPLSIGTVSRHLAPLGPENVRRRIAAAAPPRGAATPRQNRRRYLLTAEGRELRLVSAGGPANRRPLARVSLDPDDDALLEFLDVLGRVAEAAQILDRVDPTQANAAAVTWARALLNRLPPPRTARAGDDLADLNVRLVYVPASQPHPLGGLPTIGLRFLADRLERLGARADVLTIPAEDLRRRRVELLGADVIGLSVYLTNTREVARLVRLLREAGFAGRIVLGGPELREIDLIQEKVEGWDALIRGEGEEAFPEVLRVLRHLDAGEVERGLELARALRGVAIAHGDLVVLADVATRNSVQRIVCPLPFEWQRHGDSQILKMNFTRGCPYGCGFCPNHQGQRFHSCGPDEMWAFTRRAAADALLLAADEEQRRAAEIQRALGLDERPRLRPALNLLLRNPVPRDLLERICTAERPPPENHSNGSIQASPWQAKERWLADKAALLPGAASGRLDEARERPVALLPPFEIMTSEDNTLVNRDDVIAYMERRRGDALADSVVFNPGQNTVRDLTDHEGAVDLDYIDALRERNVFKVVLGVDGTSNPVLRQNHKPYYSIGEAVALNRALEERGIEVHNNYILLTPETNLLEAIEAFALFVMLPIGWRDHGKAINLRIIKEPGTRSHDEGLLFAPDDDGYDDPLRFPEVDDLLGRWELTASVHSRELPGLLWQLLAEDSDARRLLPQVVRRWERDFDGDPFLATLAARIPAKERGEVPLVDALRMVADEYLEAWPEEPDAAPDAVPLPAASESLVEGGGTARTRRPRRRAPASAPVGRRPTGKASDSTRRR